MKGQMIFEFMVAAVIFIGIVLYIIMYMSGSMGTFSSDYRSNFLESKAVQISEILAHSPGVWVDGEPVQMGLATEWPELDKAKVELLQAYCPGHAGELREMLDLVERETFLVGETPVERSYDVWINVSGQLDCSTTVIPAGEPKGAHMRRYAVLDDGEAVTLDVWVY